MTHTNTAILDFGSGKITVLVGSKGDNNLLKVKAKGMSDYAGFMDGEFLESENLYTSILNAIVNAERMLKKRIKTLYIGVPSEFAYTKTVELETYFKKPVKIKDKHISNLFEQNKEHYISNTHKIINKVAIYYKLDNDVKTINPIGIISEALYVHASFVYVEKTFISIIENIMQKLKISDYEFVSSGLAESIYLIPSIEREQSSILIDCGYITTGITHVLNDAIIDLKSFSLGGGHITSDLSEVLKIPFESAEQLKRKIVLTIDAQPSDYYEAVVDNKIRQFGAKIVNDISLARIDMIGDAIKKCFEDFSNTIKPSVSVYLTGGGIAYIKGISEYLSSYIGFNVEIAAPLPLQYNKPDLSSEIALLSVAIDIENS